MSVVYSRQGSGEPLVLLHGIGHRKEAWNPVLSRLAAHHDVGRARDDFVECRQGFFGLALR